MKIMLVCAAGISTGILMNKMKKWAEKNGEDLEVKAYGVGEYDNYYKDYDCILVGPQMSYKTNEIMQMVGNMPVGQINPMDYAIGNVDNIIKSVKLLIQKGE
ncbi:PTS sugar transporter subunit IIB [Clostridium sp. UBA1652]|nr:PTS sugar transporter subunit IIB [Clostridium sp. UBA1652]